MSEYPSTIPTMKNMSRPLKPSPEKFPKHIVNTASLNIDQGITFSSEIKDDSDASLAEFNVLKAILNREGYLNRLKKVARTIGKKFKHEVADVMDLVRASTLDVIDMIIRWRIVKRDHDAAFIWNGVNYILKIPSDLDYLSEYLAIKRWMGFTLIRNPFCIPYPLDEGQELLHSAAINPKHIESGKLTDGFMIGGMKKNVLSTKYLPTMSQSREDKEISNIESKQHHMLLPSTPTNNIGGESSSALASIHKSYYTKTNDSISVPKAFILNEDMAKIRQAELVILAEERKFGELSRDTFSRIAPKLQAMTSHASLQLKKDNYRPMIEPSVSAPTFAPHALLSDIGLADQAWTPIDIDSKEDVDVGGGDAVTSKSASHHLNANKSDNTLGANFLYSTDKDTSLLATTRGAGKSGGTLTPLQAKGAYSRVRKPLKTTLASDMEFKRNRQIRTLNEKIQEINLLRAELELQTLKLDKNISISRTPTGSRERGRTTKSADISSSGCLTTTGGGGIVSEEQKLNVVKLAVSNHTFGEVKDTYYGVIDNTNNVSRTFNDDRISTSPKARRKSMITRTSSSNNNILKSNSDLVVSNNIDKEYLHNNKNAIKDLNSEVIILQQKVDHFKHEESNTYILKESERSAKNKELSRDIERKRRLLTKEQGVRVGPPPQDGENMYDYYAIRIQKTIRGWLARCWIRWFRMMSIKATKRLQAAMRGWLGRMRVRRIRRNYNAATIIQKNFRGWITRGTSAAMAKQKNFQKAAVTVQRVWRGVLGVRRTQSKKALDAAAKLAFESVNVKALSIDDVKELATRILYAIEEPSTTAFPPDEVLHLIRISTMCIQAARGNLGIAEYDFFNARTYDEYDGQNLSWLQCAKMVNRSERFMRLLRLMAYGPGAKPPRLVQLPGDVNLLYTAQASNPKFVLKTFENMGMGSKICVQLFKWISSIIEVANRQQEFLALIASSFPDWLPKLLDLQSSVRYHEMELILNKKCLEILKSFQNESSEDELFSEVLESEMNYVKRAANDARNQMKIKLDEINILKDDQSAREVFALIALNKKVESSNIDLDDLIKVYHDTLMLANQGDREAQEALSDIRHRLTNLRLKNSEIDAQRKVLDIQVEANRAKRKDDAPLTPEIIYLGQVAGELKAQYVNSQVKTLAMLKVNGVKSAQKLPFYLVEVYDELAAEEDRLKAVARAAYVEADNMRSSYDELLNRACVSNEIKEMKSKDQMIPSDAELAEERLEDDKLAKTERAKHRQYLPDAVYLPAPTRPRPVVIGLSRDLSRFSKAKIHSEITKLMPGLFVFFSKETNMGLDASTMQSILDSRKSILMDVDPGLTRLSRDTFLQALDIVQESLIPKPFIAIAMGDEQNKSGSTYEGCDKEDLSRIMKDGNIKASLETMSYIITEIQKTEIHQAIQEHAALLIPASKHFGLVVEALFVTLSESSVYKIPDRTLSAMSWRVTRPLLIEPRRIIEKMIQIRRGSASVKALECLQCYLNHPDWPKLYGTERIADPVLNLFSLYIENYVTCERAGQAGGGVPLQALTKSSMRGIQTVVTVRDSIERREEVDLLKSGNWKMAAYRLIRTALQDLRVLKCVLKIDGSLYTVCVYRDCGNVYFEAYDSVSSDIYMTVVSVEDLPSLLIPNAYSTSLGVNLNPPQTPYEMYAALCKLLRFEVKGIKFKEKVLVCRREFTFISNITRKLNGHIALIKCYEAALGELFFTVYLPEYSAHLRCLIDANSRLAMQRNADTTGSLESEHVLKEDARPLLPYMLDRLKISPCKSMLISRGMVEIRKSELSQDKIKSQGLCLKSRVHGGVGRILLRRVCSFYRVLHIVEVRVSSVMQLLDITIYEPIQKHSMKIRLSKYMRKVLLGTVTDDYHAWYKELMRRIKLDWHGIHKINLDRSVFNGIRKVGLHRLKLSFLALDCDAICLQIIVLKTSIELNAELTKDDVIKVLLYENPAQQLQRENQKKSGYQQDVEGIIKSMEPVLPTPILEINAENYPDIYNKSFEYIITDRSKMEKLADKLVLLLTPIRVEDPSFGCISKNYPLKLKVMPIALKDTTELKEIKALDISLRRKTFLKFKDHFGDYASCIRTRRQSIMLNMENELNAMALQKSKEADMKKQTDILAALSIKTHINSLPSDKVVRMAIKNATQSVTEDILSDIHLHVIDRFRERNEPGSSQTKFDIEQVNALRHQAFLDEEEARNRKPDDEEDRMIIGNEWTHVFEAGVKTNYRDGKVRWHGHVSAKVYETSCWTEREGMGKRYKFIVYEPNVAQSFEGFIRSRKHLKEIMGLHGQDLVDHSKLKETMLFVCRFRLDVVVNKYTWDGIENPPDAPVYRIEFQSDRMFTQDKVTPINASTEVDEAANKIKLISVDNARGKKIIRLVRRVNGLLMQLTVFELPLQVAEAAYNKTKAQLLQGIEPFAMKKERTTATATAEDHLDGKEDTSDNAAILTKQESKLSVATSSESKIDENELKKYAEQRVSTIILQKYPPPAFRIVGYDTQSRRKTAIGVEPQAIIEVSGGVFSPYLHPEKRKELARVVCDSLILIFPPNMPFELMVPWSGAKKEVSTAIVSSGSTSKSSQKSSVERVLKRPGKLFRSAIRIGQYELLVTVYSHVISEVANTEDNHENRQLIFNFYSPAVSDAAEVVVNEVGQMERLGSPILKFTEGLQRSIAIRRLCSFFRAEIIYDILDSTKKTLHVVLLPPSKGYVSDYLQIAVPPPGEFLRPVGIPGVFFPLDTCGRPLYRVGMALQNRSRSMSDKEFLVTIYTKSMIENPERGLVIKLYDRSVSATSILHVGASELMRLCELADEPDLLCDIVNAKYEEERLHLDHIEKGFTELTLKGELERKSNFLENKLVVDIVLKQLGFYISPQDTIVPYMKNAPRGIFPC